MTASMLDVPAALQVAGLRVYIVPQWRSNGHDGQTLLDATMVWGTLLHHTADNSGLRAVWDPAGDIRPDVPQPRCNLWVPRALDYDVALVSAGRAYHAGTNSSVALGEVRAGLVGPATPDAHARGLVDDTNGNGRLVGIEVENFGDGQLLTAKQLRVLPRLCAALARVFGHPVGHIAHHRQVTRRKPDMQWRGDIWSMTAAVLTGKDDMPLTDDDLNKIGTMMDKKLAYATASARGDGNTVYPQTGETERKVDSLTATLGVVAGQLAALGVAVQSLSGGTTVDMAEVAAAAEKGAADALSHIRVTTDAPTHTTGAQ